MVRISMLSFAAACFLAAVAGTSFDSVDAFKPWKKNKDPKVTVSTFNAQISQVEEAFDDNSRMMAQMQADMNKQQAEMDALHAGGHNANKMKMTMNEDGFDLTHTGTERFTDAERDDFSSGAAFAIRGSVLNAMGVSADKAAAHLQAMQKQELDYKGRQQGRLQGPSSSSSTSTTIHRIKHN